MGDVSLRFLTFKGGNGHEQCQRAEHAPPGNSTGQIIIDYDIFTANSGGPQSLS